MAKKHGSDSVQAQGQSKLRKQKGEGAAPSASDSAVWVNRAPTLTLWASTVAQRQGFSRAAGNTFGKQIAGMPSAQETRGQTHSVPAGGALQESLHTARA